ncbi:MAG: hypothetical protein COV74_04075 [Candidatus Omnitrophica bacterium CG11_big_fil_rev_8_21_14_0_20_45_26]|uniref:Calcineurin-like phosphoesterase domain-containing protein n=1 Tax=Candidatus Abzuiibacterium crystallinum TaxID=1974748 RepID=A0A2H0LQ70_9BACT|nr:MAG: hypothetical protein COV74_04075 [Candidatus Omnitrophica bacterium CG11_big_fil_rev_8_21_14_0_20_45_26]PIW65781.1 MAG: hypothetical protein COW12_00070 [Candidatus Omnitrophica bacterium CG12_big_fil_rev_8_21_14_0_65_45_16]
MSRLVIFGDIHGCIDEWEMLLEKVKASPKDRLVSVGDLICKGPASRQVLDKAMSMKNLQCVIGNHEYRLLHAWKTKTLDQVKEPKYAAALDEFGGRVNHYMTFMNQWPLYLEFPECLVVHAGIRAEKPLAKQDPKDLVAIRTVGEHRKPWYESYQDKKLIVHGHWASQGLVVRDNVIGLDSGCVYGRELSAVILPERKIVSVQAKQAYCPMD